MDLEVKYNPTRKLNNEHHVLTREGDWVFDEKVAGIFDIHVRRSIPCYDVFQKLIPLLSKNFLTNGSIMYDLGSATGEVVYNLCKDNKGKDIKYIGLDISLPMVIKATEKCKRFKNVYFDHDDILIHEYKPANLFVSAFTLQFIPIDFRSILLKKIKKALNPCGALILCEKICIPDQQVNNIFIDIHEQWKLNYFSKEQIEAKKQSLKSVMQPISLNQNFDNLAKAGFTSIHPFFQWCNFIGILAK